ncbi:MAG: hypothetical protein CMN03_09745 [Roseibacillus sp.]|jgi:hypothetical protein|nr:hypothetical protein [Roseibacillus sp.]
MILILSGSVTNCGLSGKGDNSESKESKAGPGSGGRGEDGEAPGISSMRVVGEIASVHPNEKFVLIKRYFQGGGFGEGTLIASVSPGGVTSSLVLTGETLGRYHAADIQEGSPSNGDVVVVRQAAEDDIEGPTEPVPQVDPS